MCKSLWWLQLVGVLEVLGVQTPRQGEEGEVDDRPPLPGPVPARRPLADVARLHGLILNRLGPSPTAEDQLIRDLGVSAAEVTPELVTLELEGKIQRAPGGMLSRL